MILKTTTEIIIQMNFHSKMFVIGIMLINVSYFSTSFVTCDGKCYSFPQVFLGCLLVFFSLVMTIMQIVCFHNTYIENLPRDSQEIHSRTEPVSFYIVNLKCQCDVCIGTTPASFVCVRNPCICNI